MSDAILGSVTIPVQINYEVTPTKLEVLDRSIDGTLIVNYVVNNENTAVTKYRFELSNVTRSQRMAIRAEALKTGNVYFVDHIMIPEVFSYTTDSIALQRHLGSTSATNIAITLDGVAQGVTVTTSAPTTGYVSVTSTGGMVFGTAGTTGTNNIVVYYIPKYEVHITNDSQQLLWRASSTDHIVKYNMSLEEC